MIYFVQDGEFVKVGWSLDAARRLRDISALNPRPMTVLGVIEGDLSHERYIHKLFADERTVGEWFRATPALLSWIRDVVKRGAFELPPASEPPTPKFRPREGLPTYELRRIAVQVGCDPRTVDKYFKGQRVRDNVLERIERFVAKKAP